MKLEEGEESHKLVLLIVRDVEIKEGVRVLAEVDKAKEVDAEGVSGQQVAEEREVEGLPTHCEACGLEDREREGGERGEEGEEGGEIVHTE